MEPTTEIVTKEDWRERHRLANELLREFKKEAYKTKEI